MRSAVAAVVGLAALAAVACAAGVGSMQAVAPATPAGVGPSPVEEAPENPWAPAAREVLVQHCGRCHRSDLPTAIPGALAVFDLTQDRWYDAPTDEQLEKMLGRIQGSDDIVPEDRSAVVRFVRCRRDGECREADER